MFIGSWTLLGIFGLLIGWIGLLELNPFIGLPWISNLLYFISLFSKNLKLDFRIGITITAICFGLFAIGIREVPENEGGGTTSVYVGIGFVIWMSSFIYLLTDQIKERKNKNVG